LFPTTRSIRGNATTHVLAFSFLEMPGMDQWWATPIVETINGFTADRTDTRRRHLATPFR
jgi:hypothetical protein